MYHKYLGLKKTPFAEQPDPDIFFPEADRTKILRAVYADLQAGEPIVKVTGAEGTGKTLLCLLLVRLIPDRFKIVYVDSPVGSFEDLLHTVCIKLGMQTARPADMLSALHTLLKHYSRRKKRVVVIIDEADQMFPAALERLVRTAGAGGAGEGEPAPQIILAGRPELNEHIEQLTAYCSDVEIQSGHTLEVLNEEETTAYLNFRLKSAGFATAGNKKPIFSEGAVRRITKYASGSLLLTNRLADRALEQTFSDNQSLPVLLGHVVELKEKNNNKKTGDTEPERKRGLVVVLLFLFLLSVLLFQYTYNDEFRRSAPGLIKKFSDSEMLPQSRRPDSSPHIAVQEEISSENTTAAPTTEEQESEVQDDTDAQPDTADSLSSVSYSEHSEITEVHVANTEILPEQGMDDNVGVGEQQESSVQPTQSAPLPEETKPLVQDEHRHEQERAAAEETVPDTYPPMVISTAEQEDPSSWQEEEEEDIPEITDTSLPVAPDENEPATLEEEEISEWEEPEQKKIVQLVPGMRKTRRTLTLRPTNQTVEARTEENREVSVTSAEPEVEPLQGEIRLADLEVKSAAFTPDMSAAERIYQDLLTAGVRLRSSFYANKYTIHLLMRSSTGAVDAVKRMIVRDEYLEHKEQLHILRRRELPAAVFMYYGVYNSMDEAREARNNMPLFLRKHHPYALPVESALNKATN